MIYPDLLYVYSLLRRQHVECDPPADRLDCSISIKMDSQPCGGTKFNSKQLEQADTVLVPMESVSLRLYSDAYLCLWHRFHWN